jgi:hypothetical protein
MPVSLIAGLPSAIVGIVIEWYAYRAALSRDA